MQVQVVESFTCSMTSPESPPWIDTSSTDAEINLVTWLKAFCSSIGISIRSHNSTKNLASSCTCKKVKLYLINLQESIGKSAPSITKLGKQSIPLY